MPQIVPTMIILAVLPPDLLSLASGAVVFPTGESDGLMIAVPFVTTIWNDCMSLWVPSLDTAVSVHYTFCGAKSSVIVPVIIDFAALNFR
jgi:hypothetical protein